MDDLVTMKRGCVCVDVESGRVSEFERMGWDCVKPEQEAHHEPEAQPEPKRRTRKAQEKPEGVQD